MDLSVSVSLQVCASLGQLGQGDRVVVMSSRSIIVHLPPGSRMNVSDESLMIGVGRFSLGE